MNILATRRFWLLLTPALLLVLSFLYFFAISRGQMGGPEEEVVVIDDGKQLRGYAWSSNVGWFSFGNGDYDPATYGVYLGPLTSLPGDELVQVRLLSGKSLDGAYDVPGYAYSDHLGWIKFDPNFGSLSHPELNDFPNASDNHAARLNVETGQFSGWAQACGVFENENLCYGALKNPLRRGSWDGWIKMSGDTSSGGAYVSRADLGQAPTRFTADSYAWGGEPVGWISWCASDNLYCVRFGGLMVDCSTDPAGSNPRFYLGPSGTFYLGSTSSLDVSWHAALAAGAPPYTYNWTWSDGSSASLGPTAQTGFDASQTYTCPAAAGTYQGYMTVVDNNGDSASCSLTRDVDCSGTPPAESEANLSIPSASAIRISGHPLASTAISLGTSFYNDGGEAEILIKSTNSLVNQSVSLSDFPEVKCRMENTPLLADPTAQLGEFRSCDGPAHGALLLVPGTANDTAYFNVEVLPEPLAGLGGNNPYKIVVGEDGCTETPEPGETSVCRSFIFSYDVATPNYGATGI